MAPVIAAAVISAAAAVTTSVISSKQADKASKRQQEYQQQVLNQQKETEAKEKQLTDESKQRSRAYGLSLLDSDTNMQNMLSGGYDEENLGNNSLLSNTLGSGSVGSMFS